MLSLLPFLLWGALPGVGLAAQDAPLASARLSLMGPLADPEAPVSGASQETPMRSRSSLGSRMITEVGAGLVTALAGGAVGGLTGFWLCDTLGVGRGVSGDLECGQGLILGAVLGIVEGYAVGVWWGGEVMGGDGHLLHTLVGANLGAVLSTAVMLAASPSLTVAPFVVLASVMLGSHLGYELFQRPAPAKVASRLFLQPVVSFSAHGAMLGWGGHF